MFWEDFNKGSFPHVWRTTGRDLQKFTDGGRSPSLSLIIVLGLHYTGPKKNLVNFYQNIKVEEKKLLRDDFVATVTWR